jgi:hypothetical protein
MNANESQRCPEVTDLIIRPMQCILLAGHARRCLAVLEGGGEVEWN